MIHGRRNAVSVQPVFDNEITCQWMIRKSPAPEHVLDLKIETWEPIFIQKKVVLRQDIIYVYLYIDIGEVIESK